MTLAKPSLSKMLLLPVPSVTLTFNTSALTLPSAAA